MSIYFFQGTVLPERAQLGFSFENKLSTFSPEEVVNAKVSIILNQIAVWIEAEKEWDMFDLRNLVNAILKNELAKLSFLTGIAYEFVIDRVTCQSEKIDYVFGVDIPCLTERQKNVNVVNKMIDLRTKTMGLNGIFINRCFTDLVSAMKYPVDTAFYCYRAIEALRHHCNETAKKKTEKRSKQWETFRKVTGIEKSDLDLIKQAADPLRHGNVVRVTSEQREKFFNLTWNIVERYLEKIPSMDLSEKSRRRLSL